LAASLESLPYQKDGGNPRSGGAGKLLSSS